MSKCREEFKRIYGIEIDNTSSLLREGWKAAWNARGKVDAEICKPYEDYPGEHAEAIEKEDEK